MKEPAKPEKKEFKVSQITPDQMKSYVKQQNELVLESKIMEKKLDLLFERLRKGLMQRVASDENSQKNQNLD